MTVTMNDFESLTKRAIMHDIIVAAWNDMESYDFDRFMALLVGKSEAREESRKRWEERHTVKADAE